jgi:thiosulfate/3-mercaptopyruvate sulfurtransferase
VAVLDGGIHAWTAAGHELETDEPRHPPAQLALLDTWSRVIDRPDLTQRLGQITILDARAPERYRGEVEPIDPAAGHIPTALNFPTGGNLDERGRFLPPARLRDRFQPIVAGGDPVVTPSPCARQGSPTRFSTPARSAIGVAPTCPLPRAPNRASRRLKRPDGTAPATAHDPRPARVPARIRAR